MEIDGCPTFSTVMELEAVVSRRIAREQQCISQPFDQDTDWVNMLILCLPALSLATLKLSLPQVGCAKDEI